MIYIYIAVLAVYVLLYIVSWREECRGPFRRMASYLLRRQLNSSGQTGAKRGWRKDIYRRQLGDKLKALQPDKAVQIQVREYYLSQYSVILTVIFAGVSVCMAVWLSAHSSSLLVDGSYIWRNSYGEGDIPVELAAQIMDGEEEIFRYTVEERKYTQEEAEALYRKMAEAIPEAIRGQNERLEDVRYDLELVTRIDGYPFEISWESDSYALVNTDGTIYNTELEKGEIVTLTAHVRYEEWNWDEQIHVQINPIVYTQRELMRRRIEELLHMQEQRTGSTEAMILPDSVESKPIIWREIVEDGSGYLMCLILIAAGILYWGRGRELDRQLEKRKRELTLDYPEIVNKLALYMGAGMTIRNAFTKMGEDYKKQQKERRRYVYEEILITCHELQSGRSEREAYDHFGRRCQVQAYMKLSTLLSQNIRKGSNDLLDMLRQEADNAFTERKALAKKLGEEAGTKLLLPMMMMLCIVMVVIMIPAYFSFMM
ncbi:MAG: type II secretion system F family protein [Lachnospiraceae bacterium]|nr:type II secretion system F family protein [Lachnospiraceae bacterium]